MFNKKLYKGSLVFFIPSKIDLSFINKIYEFRGYREFAGMIDRELKKNRQYANIIEESSRLIKYLKDTYSNKIIILSAIDNLIKGGAGQAVQNLNNKFNFSETTGLK